MYKKLYRIIKNKILNIKIKFKNPGFQIDFCYIKQFFKTIFYDYFKKQLPS